MIVSDNGWGKDAFSLTPSNGYSISGTLSGGNIQLHTGTIPSFNADREEMDGNARSAF